MSRSFFLPDGQPNGCGCDQCGPLAIAAAPVSAADGGPVARAGGRASCDARLVASRTTVGVR